MDNEEINKSEYSLGMLIIHIDTDISNSKKLIYNPTMTLSGGTSSKAIIYFPENIELKLSDLGDDTVRKHDKIKIFLSEARLIDIIETKMKNKSQPAKLGNYGNNNVKLLLKLLFSPDENFFLKGVKYSILSYDTDMLDTMEPIEKLYKVQKASSNQQTVVDRSQLRERILKRNLYIVKVTLVLIKAEKSKSKLYCERKKLDIKRQTEIVSKSFLSKTSGETTITKERFKTGRDYVLPQGYLSLNDWRVVPVNFSKKNYQEYYVNFYTGRTQIPYPVPFQLISDVKEWNFDVLGSPPPPPRSAQPQFIQAPPMAEVPPTATQPAAPLIQPSAPPMPPASPSAEAPKADTTATGGGKLKKVRKSRKLRKTRKKYHKPKSYSRKKNSKRNAGQKFKTLKATPERIQKALKKNNLDSGNMSVYFASIKPANYFSEQQISSLNK